MNGTWMGTIDGTNKGSISLVLSEQGGKISGLILVNDIKFQSVSAKVEVAVSRDGKSLTGRTFEFQPIAEGNPTKGTISAEILENGLELKGEWKTDIGTQGAFVAFKRIEDQDSKPAAPTAFISKPVNLPPCRLGVNELAGLLSLLMKDIAPDVQPSFTVNYRGSTYFKTSIKAFTEDRALPRRMNDLAITINELNSNKGYKVVNVSFKQFDNNTLSVSDDDSTWANGRAREIEDYVTQHKSVSTEFFSKYGGNLNGIIFLISAGVPRL